MHDYPDCIASRQTAQPPPTFLPPGAVGQLATIGAQPVAVFVVLQHLAAEGRPRPSVAELSRLLAMAPARVRAALVKLDDAGLLDDAVLLGADRG